MQTLVINVEDNINIADFSSQLKKLYPFLHLEKFNISINSLKKFTGTADLKSIHVDNFKMYQREELYDR